MAASIEAKFKETFILYTEPVIKECESLKRQLNSSAIFTRRHEYRRRYSRHWMQSPVNKNRFTVAANPSIRLFHEGKQRVTFVDGDLNRQNKNMSI